MRSSTPTNSRSEPTSKPSNLWRSSPPAMLLYSFLALVFIGSLLLKADWANNHPITWMQALFTATSAVTITGLVVVDTASQFTLAGQLVILVLIQLGGIGLMTFAVLAAMIFGFRIGLSHQLLAREVLNQTSLSSVGKAARSIALFALIIELSGAAILSAFWIPEKGLVQGLYHGLFYSVSAFNNAGFALAPNSLTDLANNAGIVLTVSALYIIGGLGYMAVIEIWDKRRGGRLSVYTRMIIHATIILNAVAVTAFFALEFHNPETLGQVEGLGDKLIASWFQGTVPRSSGFNTVDIGAITAATTTLFLVLMFIGAAPNSTGGGIKITTFMVMAAATRAFIRGRADVTLYKRTVSHDSVIKALAITVIGMIIAFLTIFALTITEQAAYEDIVFEGMSAFGTVGLSRGLTSDLSHGGQLVVIVVMMIGRIGPLTLGYMLTKPIRSHVRYASTEFPVG